MLETVTVQFGKTIKEYDVIPEPVPHILVKTRKPLHGWWPGKRECTAERLIVNPYNGCNHDCFFCYAHTLWGYLEIYRKHGIITVCKDYDKEVAKQLDSLDVASCGYISAVTDPFQPINRKYRLTEKIINEFVSRNLPVEVITKNVISDKALALLEKHPKSFGAISILTPHEHLRRQLVPGGASTEKLLQNLRNLRDKNLFAIARIDPIFPFLTDDIYDLETLVKMVVDAGANHIIASIVDFRYSIIDDCLDNIERIKPGLKKIYEQLYTEKIGSNFNAKIGYRRKIFDRLRTLVDQQGITFALCMEYETIGNQVRGLNADYMTSVNCEGIDIPIYRRNGDIFQPIADCHGNCLNCTTPICGIDDLAMGNSRENVDWKLPDYRRWGRELKEKNQLELLH